jgi:hypothetical protein
MSLAASLERDARRINLKHVVLQHSRGYTSAVGLALLALSVASDRHDRRVVGALVPRVVLLLMATAAVFRLMGGYIARLEPVEHGKKLTSQLSDAVSDCISVAFGHPVWCLVACSVLAEVSQIFCLTGITASVLAVVWFYPTWRGLVRTG